MKKLAMLILILTTFLVSPSEAKNANYKKTQEVNFDETNIDGQVRTPDGAYLHQKRGMKFIPLYKVRTEFDGKVKKSVEYLR